MPGRLGEIGVLANFQRAEQVSDIKLHGIYLQLFYIIIENTNGFKKDGIISFISPSAETSLFKAFT